MRHFSLPKSGVHVVAFFVCSFGLILSSPAQDITKKRLDHDAYDLWNTLTTKSISDDGKWVMYAVQSGAIDGESITHVVHLKTGRHYEVARAVGTVFTPDSRFAICRVLPRKKDDSKSGDAKDSSAKPSLQYLDLVSGDVVTIDNVRSFSVAEKNGRWLTCQLESTVKQESVNKTNSQVESYRVTNEGLAPVTKPLKLKSREVLAKERGELEENPNKEKAVEKVTQKKSQTREEKSESGSENDNEKKKEKPDGKPLMLIDLLTGIQRTYPDVTESVLSRDGRLLAFATSVKKNDTNHQDQKQPANQQVLREQADASISDQDGVYLINLGSFGSTKVLSQLGEYRGLTFSEDGEMLSFLSNREDYEAKTPAWSIYLTNTKKVRPVLVATEKSEGLPASWWVAPGSNLSFSKNNERLYFDTAPISDSVLAEREKKNDGTGSDPKKKAKLDLWHWKDPQLQPQQLLQVEAEKKRSYRAAYQIDTKQVVQLEDRRVPDVRIDDRSSATVAIANTNLPYRKTLSWDYPGFQDVYLIDLESGKRRKISEKVKWNAFLSPGGKFVVWFDAVKRHWFAISTKGASAKPVQISRGIKHPLQDELHDTPNLPSAYGVAGWLVGDQGLLVYDRYDIWKLDPAGKQSPVCLTFEEGRKNELSYRYLTLDREEVAIEPESTVLLSAFNQETKASGFYSLDLSQSRSAKDASSLRRLIMLNESVSGLVKAKNNDQVMFTRSTFRQCPDLWSSDLRFETVSRISDINPQQEEYSWGTAELVHWKAADGQELDGILMKPDGFDPSKKYPMMVYFYERNSDNLHRYYTPAAGRSIICHSFYVSRGYLVFVPDIPYKTGQPGPSAVNAILPGVDSIVDLGFVKEDKIGIQGHSWGGYQTAYLVTQTDRFACAESGAPVSNMTSAYGGIRWGSGLSRMFQYERTQSRIGEDLWSAREKYIANSPLFFADKINTPLLILHNDQDGAVPWYQGIELFVALRRLGRPAWMLNYNDEPHWVMDDYNRRDFAKRMQQFFDHYLLDAPEPQWMAVGIPATEKGEDFGLELLEPEK